MQRAISKLQPRKLVRKNFEIDDVLVEKCPPLSKRRQMSDSPSLNTVLARNTSIGNAGTNTNMKRTPNFFATPPCSHTWMTAGTPLAPLAPRMSHRPRQEITTVKSRKPGPHFATKGSVTRVELSCRALTSAPEISLLLA